MRSRDPWIFEFYVLKVSDVLNTLKSRTAPDQDQQNWQPRSEQDKQKLEISDRTGPGPIKICKPRTGLGPTNFRKTQTDSDRPVL